MGNRPVTSHKDTMVCDWCGGERLYSKLYAEYGCVNSNCFLFSFPKELTVVSNLLGENENGK